MAKFRIDHSFETVGAFWRFGQEEQHFTGTLKCRKGRIEVLSAPSYIPLLDQEAVCDAFAELSVNRQPSVIPSLCGFTTHEFCTLLRVTVLTGSSNANLPLARKISTTRYLPQRSVIGFHLESAEALFFDGCSFYFTKVHHLMPQPWSEQMNSEAIQYVAPMQSKEVFNFFSIGINAEIICEVFATGGSRLRKGTWIKSVPRIRVNLKERQSVDWLAALAFRTENFFALFLGTSLSLKRLMLTQEDVPGWLVQKMGDRREKVNEELIIRCPLPLIAEAYDRWLSVPEGKRPLELVVLGVLRKSTFFDETKFMSLAQALEGFGNLRFAYGVNQSPKFASLIEQSYDLLSPDFAVQIVGERTVFVRQVVDTRTYYFHIGKPIGPAAIKERKKLYLFNKRLEAFLRCLMLLDLSIPEEYLREPIRYQATRWRVV